MPGKYTKINDIEIQDIVLESRLGSKFSLMSGDLLLQVHILESINLHTLTGEIIIEDGANFIGHFPLIGQEFLHITFATPLGDNDYITHRFYIYKVSPRFRPPVEEGGNVERYALHFASPELIENSHLKCQKSYNGTASSIVKSIMQDNWPKAKVVLEHTSNQIRFISPYWNPFQCIEYLAERSVASAALDRMESNFVFYQTLSTTEGGVYNFRSLSSLAEEPSRQIYHLSQGDGQGIDSLTDLSVNLSAIQEYKNEKYADKWENIQTGMLASTLYTHDITYKNFTSNTFSYIKDFYSAGHVNENKMMPVNNDTLSPMVDSVIHYKPRQDNLYHNYFEPIAYTANREPIYSETDIELGAKKQPDIDNFKYEEWFLSRKSLIEQINSQRNKILVAGDTRIQVGNVVTINIPTVEVHTETSDINDLNVGGRFLITAIRHIINLTHGKEHTMWLELSRDSLPKAIPDQVDFLGLKKLDIGTTVSEGVAWA